TLLHPFPTRRSSDLTFNYTTVNVEAHLEQPTSLLHWMRGMLHVRRQHPAFGVGDYLPVESDDEAVLAYLRVSDEEAILCVNNFSPSPRAAHLTMENIAGFELHD